MEEYKNNIIDISDFIIDLSERYYDCLDRTKQKTLLKLLPFCHIIREELKK